MNTQELIDTTGPVLRGLTALGEVLQRLKGIESVDQATVEANARLEVARAQEADHERIREGNRVRAAEQAAADQQRLEQLLALAKDAQARLDSASAALAGKQAELAAVEAQIAEHKAALLAFHQSAIKAVA